MFSKFNFIFLLLILKCTKEQVKPISRINVVPYQKIDTTMDIGVVAFHKDGIEKVEFEISGCGYTGPVKEAREMRLNTRTNVFEYFVGINSNEFTSDGIINVEVTVKGKDGGVRDKNSIGSSPKCLNSSGMETLKLTVNPLGTLQNFQVWVDSTNGDNNHGIDAVNDNTKPVQAIVRAVQLCEEYRESNGYGTNIDGCNVMLLQGVHLWENGGLWGFNPSAKIEWIIFKAADGLTRDEVFIERGGLFNIEGLVKVEGVTIRNTGNGRAFEMSSSQRSRTLFWVNDCNCLCYDMFADSCYAYSGTYRTYVTNVYVENQNRGPGGVLVRNVKVQNISDDAFQNSLFVMNAEIDWVYPKCPTDHPGIDDPTQIDIHCNHADLMQLWNSEPPDNPSYICHDNAIYFGLKGTNLFYQGLFLRGDVTNPPVQADGMAFVNIQTERSLIARENVWNGFYRSVNHLLWYHVSSLPTMAFNLYNDALGNDLYPVITNWRVVGNLFNLFNHNVQNPNVYYNNWEGWENNHFVDISGVCPGFGNSNGSDIGLDENHIPTKDSILVNRIPRVVPNDIINNRRGELSDIGAYEYVENIETTNTDNVGVVIGVVVGVVIILALFVLGILVFVILVVFCLKKKGDYRKEESIEMKN